MRTPLRCTFVACLALACGHADAHAAERPEGFAVRVRVRAPSDCATEATFWSALSRRTDRLTRAATPSANANATIEVAITRAGTEAANGELRIIRAGQVSERRRLTAMTCAEVSDGLSLVAALAFDPAAKLVEEPVADDARTDSALPTAVATVNSSASSSSPAATDSPSGATDSRGPTPVDRREERAPRTARRWLFSVGGNAGGVAMGDPGTSVLYGGFAEIAWQRGLVAPSLRLGATYTAAETNAAPVRAGLSWTLGRGSVCPIRLALARGLTLRPCAGADVGVLAASTRDRGVTTARDRSRPWIAPSVAARLAWTPVSWAFVEVQGSVAAPVVRDQIVVDPSLALYQAPILVPSAEVGAGVSF